jgi:hypothetical protein
MLSCVNPYGGAERCTTPVAFFANAQEDNVGRVARIVHRVDARKSLSYNGRVSLQIAACPNHPQREAIGICVRCRKRVCSECATKVDGINYCVDCLAALAGQDTQAKPAESSRLGAYLSASTYLVALIGLVWMLLKVMLPGMPH